MPANDDDFLIYLCSCILSQDQTNTTFRAACYVVTAGILSLAGALIRMTMLPLDEFCPDKKGPLNEFLAKRCLSWTLVALGLYFLCTKAVFVYLRGWRKTVLRFTFRMLTVLSLWGLVIWFFDHVKEVYGPDVSGHIYLLSFCSLVLAEEAASYEKVQQLQRDVVLEVERRARGGHGNRTAFTNCSERLFYIIKLLYVRPVTATSYFLIAALSLSLDSIYLSTALCFHTIPEKIGGSFFGIVCWWLTYKCIFSLVLKWKPEDDGT